MTARHLLALFVVPLVVAFAAPAWAGEAERDVEALERRIDVLSEEAEALAEEGRKDAADILRRRVRALRAELRELKEEREGQDVEQEVEGAVEFVLELLREVAEGDEDRDALDLLARALREKMEDVEEAAEEHAEEGRERAEVRRARRWLAVMRTAVPAFLEAERRDLAESMQRSIRAWELRLERRRDAEALAVYERAPKMEALVEMLGFAASLYEEWGKADRAHALQETSQALLQRHRKAQKGTPRREPGPNREALVRLERLEARLAELVEVATHLQKQVQDLKRELR